MNAEPNGNGEPADEDNDSKQASIPNTPPANSHNAPPQKNKWRIKDRPMFSVTVAGFFAVVAYTSVAAWQASLTGDQLTVMQRQLDDSEILEAASVTIKNITVQGFPNNTIISFDISNDGRSRADQFANMVFPAAVPKKSDPGALRKYPPAFLPPNTSGISINPSDPDRHFVYSQPPLPHIDDAWPYFVIVASYLDVFRKPHHLFDCVILYDVRVGFQPCPY